MVIIEKYNISINQLKIKRKNLENILFGLEQEKAGFFIDGIERVYNELNLMDDIRGGFQIQSQTNFSLLDKGFYLGSTFFNTGEIIAQNLLGSEKLAIFICTAGNTISNRINQANQAKDYILSYIYDAAGTVLAECAADFIESMLEQKAKQMGLRITNRYGPGYCGWNVAEQHKLFSFLPRYFCNVKLTDSALMVPLKSISGVIGLGKNAVKRNYGCNLCNMKQCYRKVQTYGN